MGFWFFGKKKGKSVPLLKHKKLKIGLALGGGGARGIGHIGVIKAFEELGLDFDYIAGTSAGSFAGAFYAMGYTSLQMEEIVKRMRTKDIRTSKWIFKPSKAQAIEEYIISVLGQDVVFSQLVKPFKAVAVNIRNGAEIDIDGGSVAKAVSASCAVPGVFTPVQIDNMLLVDGGLKNTVPADVVRKMGADVVIAIDVNHRRGMGTDSSKTLSILGSTIGMLMRDTIQEKLKYADVVLEPELTQFSSSKLENIDEMIQEGYDCVMKSLDKISPLVSSKLSRRKKRKWKKLMANG